MGLPHMHQANYSTDRGKPCPLIDVYDSMDNEGQMVKISLMRMPSTPT